MVQAQIFLLPSTASALHERNRKTTNKQGKLKQLNLHIVGLVSDTRHVYPLYSFVLTLSTRLRYMAHLFREYREPRRRGVRTQVERNKAISEKTNKLLSNDITTVHSQRNTVLYPMHLQPLGKNGCGADDKLSKESIKYRTRSSRTHTH